MQDLYLPHIGSFNFLVDEGLSLAVQVSFNIFRLNLRSFMWGELIRVYGYKSKHQFATRISRRCHIVTTCGRPTALLHSRVSQNRTQDFSRRKFKHTLTGLYNNFHTCVLLYGSTLFMTLIPRLQSWALFAEISAARLESLEIARGRFRKFNSKYIESIKSVQGISPPRDTNFPHWISGAESLSKIGAGA